MSASPDFLERHKRHLMLKEIGGPGVQKLQNASVTLIGAGALGGPCALYLAAAGIGALEIFDDDTVERSNLQRQVQFGEADVGKPKAALLAGRASAISPDMDVTTRAERYDGSEALSGTIIVDASDNFETRYAINSYTHANARAMVHGAAAGWAGQVAVFASGLGSDNPCYRCWVPETPPDPQACDEIGVVGALTGLVGTQMALEVIKLVTGAGEPLIGRIALFDGLSSSHRTVRLGKDPACPTCAH